MLASPWGVRIDLGDSYPEELKEYVDKLGGSDISLEGGETVSILKADIKERKGDFTLIFRYKLN